MTFSRNHYFLYCKKKDAFSQVSIQKPLSGSILLKGVFILYCIYLLLELIYLFNIKKTSRIFPGMSFLLLCHPGLMGRRQVF